MRRPRRNLHRPQTKKLAFRHVFLLSFTIFLILTATGFWLVEKSIRPTLLTIATTEARKIATEAINDAVSKKIADSLDIEDIIEMDKDEDGNVTNIRFNTRTYNRVLSETTGRVQRYLRALERGEIVDLTIPDDFELDHSGAINNQDEPGNIIYTIPLGQATNNALLAHLGPKVPVRLSSIGDVKSTINRDIESTGINNTYISLNIFLEVDVKIVIPFATSTQLVQTTFPVGTVFVQGKVPDVYSEGSGGMIIPGTPTN